MERIPVESSDLASIGYDANTSILEIQFNNGSIYQYSDVPEGTYDGLMTAESKGRFLDQHVKKAGYSYTRVR